MSIDVHIKLKITLMDLNLLFFSIHIALKNSSSYFLGSLAPSSIKKIHFIKKQKWVAIIKKKWLKFFFYWVHWFFSTCLPQVCYRNNLIVKIWKLHARKENSKSSREASQCRLNDKVRIPLRVTIDIIDLTSFAMSTTITRYFNIV